MNYSKFTYRQARNLFMTVDETLPAFVHRLLESNRISQKVANKLLMEVKVYQPRI